MASEKKEPRIHKYLKYVGKLKASDLHFKSNARVRIRHKGSLKPIKGAPLSAQEVEDIWFEIMNECLRQIVETEFIETDVAYAASPNPQELKMRLKGISTGGGILA